MQQQRNSHDDRHVIFDQSLTDRSYQYSLGSAVAPSTLETIGTKLPVESGHFFSPPNSLRLSWQSRSGGDWLAEIHLERRRGREQRLEGSTLSFWCFAPQPLSPVALPLLEVGLKDGPRTRSLRLDQIVPDFPAGRWIQILVPFQMFDTSTRELDFSMLDRVIFSQSIDDELPHTLYLDEIRVLDPGTAGVVSQPAGLVASAYDRHIDLQWSAATGPEVAYYVVHRSDDGQSFRPIGIQRPSFDRFTDFVGQTNTQFHYRVTAVGHDYRESDASGIVSATTRAMSDDELLSMVQEASFRYYWERGHPIAGLALECVPGDENLVATGASGFGIMALIVGAERGFVTREAVRARVLQAVTFLAAADRFHGAWPHFLDGRTGKAVPFFGKYDNGGDLVETAFLIQGLLAARQYFDRDEPAEAAIRSMITRLWETVEWNWYRRSPESEVLYWHWSPDYDWHINHPLIGWNETMIAYILAIASPTHAVPASLYDTGWASEAEFAQRYRQNWGKTTAGDRYPNGQTYYGLQLDVGVGTGGPLFFTHYSFLGFDPRGKRDRFTNYFHNNRTLSLINHRYCAANPGGYVGYGEAFWGLTASDDHTGYMAHDPTLRNDNGTITPTAALAAFPYTPEESMQALKHFYYNLGDKMWGIYGFRDAYNPTEEYVSSIFMGLNQAPIVVMIENYRSGLPWKLFMSNSEIPIALEKIGFVPDHA